LAVSASGGKRRASLWLWVGPIVALIGIYLAATALATPECGEGGGASSLEMGLFTALVAVASIVCFATAIADPVRRWRRRDPRGGLVAQVLTAGLSSLYLIAATLAYLVIFLLVLLSQSGSAC
jgi:uncharacterized membrane protein YhaH (DUF805 family)